MRRPADSIRIGTDDRRAERPRDEADAKRGKRAEASRPARELVTFYTTDRAGRGSAPIVYCNGQKISEAIKGQSIRITLRPGTYQFAFTEDAPTAQQLSIWIGGGQGIFLRVARTAFFIGSAAEANASLRTVTPSAAPAVVPQVTAAAPRPDPRAQSVQVKQSLSSRGIPGVLRCTGFF
jgi:hypothetical protein